VQQVGGTSLTVHPSRLAAVYSFQVHYTSAYILTASQLWFAVSSGGHHC